MFSTTLSLNTNDEVIKLIDKDYNHFLIHQFNPTYSSDWKHADVKMNGVSLKDITVRKMSFDILCDIKKVEEITLLNIPYLNIYQFSKPISDSLLIENLKPVIKDRILLQNGLQRKYFINNEYITIYSFDESFINNIENNPYWKDSILKTNS
jgi:hypothetical protein